MAQITSSVGLISGINTSQIINELISLDAQPVTLLQNRVSSATAQTQAYQALGTQLSQLQTIAQSLQLPSTFAAATAQSSDQTVLTGTASAGAADGSYNLNVASLVTSQQAISNGYSSANALIGAGTISISQGGGEASSQTTLAELNGGTGVQRGQFRITDGSGASSVIDLSTAVTLDDVVNKINSALNVSVHATIKDNQLVLQDTSGQNKNNFSVSDLGSGTAAADLGIVGSTSGTTITGTNINSISNATPLSELNDGRGVGISGASDFQVNLSDGSSAQVSLSGAQTVGDVLAAINKAGGSKFNATIDTTNNSIKLNDTSGGTGTFKVTPLNNSSAAADLGIVGNVNGPTLGGKTLIASIDSVLTSSLNGGSGLALGTIRLTDRTGASKDVDLSNATSVQDILNSINGAGLHLTAALNNAGDGIQLQDTSSSGGNIVVSDVDSTTAAQLGIAGTFDTSKSVITGSDLHAQYVSGNTLLSQYNGGKGVDLSNFTITNSKGISATVDLSVGNFTTIGDVIGAINAKQLGVTASINANGDGLLLTDTAGGGSKLKVAEGSGTTAADLNIAGAATGTTIDGSLTKTIAVSATDTLTTLQKKISDLGFGVSANIVNDGSGNNGYHLALTSLNSGRAGRVTIDGGATSLTTQNVVEARDAAVFYGGSNSASSLLVTSSSNQLANIIPGVTVQLQGTGAATLTVSPDASGISTQLQTFATTFNDLQGEISTLTQWNTTTNQGGLLLGDATAADIQQQLYTIFDSVVNGAGQYKLSSDIGLSLGSDGTATFDSNKFASAYAANPTDVQNLFTQTKSGLATLLNNSLNQLIDPVSGEVTLQESTLSTQIDSWNSQITDLNTLLDQKKATLQTEYANMETVLAGLQAQGQQLSQIGSFETSLASTSAAANTSSSSKSTSSSGG